MPIYLSVDFIFLSWSQHFTLPGKQYESAWIESFITCKLYVVLRYVFMLAGVPCTYSLLCYLRSAMPCLSSTCGLCRLRRCSSKHFASQLSALCKRTKHSLGLSRAKAKNSACFSRLTHYFVERIIALKNDVILTAAKSCQKNLKLTLLSKDS